MRIALVPVLALGLALLAGGSGCQKNTGIFLNLATDLESPSELAGVRLRVMSDERVTFDNSGEPWRLGPGEEIQLPGSLAFYAEQGAPVATFVVDGLDDRDQVIVTRTAVLSTVPGEMLYLRVKLSRACVSQAAGGSLAESCEEGLTCIEGRCVPAEVDPADLPRYTSGSPETLVECSTTSPLVDTGSGDPLEADGSCEAGQRCQEGLCIKDPGCQSGECVCPGDVCEAQTLALSQSPVRLAVSGDHVYFTELGDGPGQGRVRRVDQAGGPLLDVATGLINPGPIRFLDGRLVFADRGGAGNSDGSIHVQAEVDGDVVLYQREVPDPTDVYVDSTQVHWLREDGCLKFLLLETPDVPYETWVCGPVAAHAFARHASGTFFWLTGDSGVNYAPAPGDGPHVLTELGTSPSSRGDAMVVNDTLLVTDGTTVWGRTTLEEGADQEITSGDLVSSLLADEEGVLVADAGRGTITRHRREGGPPVVVATGLSNPRSLGQNDEAIFFIQDDGARSPGRITRLPRKN